MARGRGTSKATGRRKAPRAPLSRERVLAAALALADAEGLEAVTMRRVASALRVEAMSLYHHLPGKEALLDGLLEVLVGEIQAEVAALTASATWKEDLRARCLAARRVMLRHRWGPTFIATRTSIPPGVMLHFDGVLGVMLQGGLSFRLAHRALHALGSMILGFVQELFAPAGAADEAALDEDFDAMAAALPHLTAMIASEQHAATDPTLGWCDSQTEFEFTLDLLLDGLDRARAAPGQSS